MHAMHQRLLCIGVPRCCCRTRGMPSLWQVWLCGWLCGHSVTVESQALVNEHHSALPVMRAWEVLNLNKSWDLWPPSTHPLWSVMRLIEAKLPSELCDAAFQWCQCHIFFHQVDPIFRGENHSGLSKLLSDGHPMPPPQFLAVEYRWIYINIPCLHPFVD